MKSPEIYHPTATDYEEITSVWESSVRATHTFLSEEDISYFKPLIRNEYLNHIQLICIKDPSGKICAFMGVSGNNLEMLFIQPDERGKGLGKFLINYAINKMGIQKVDVNEQNEQALYFYYKMGFEVISRDETDSMGKPFPILHLQLISS